MTFRYAIVRRCKDRVLDGSEHDRTADFGALTERGDGYYAMIWSGGESRVAGPFHRLCNATAALDELARAAGDRPEEALGPGQALTGASAPKQPGTVQC